MPRFNHMYVIAYVVISEDEHGRDVTPEMHREALEKRMDAVDANNEWDEAVGGPENTHIESDT